MSFGFGRKRKALLVAIVAALALTAGGASALGHSAAGASFTNRVFASGAKVFHPTPKGKAAISQPDDITYLGGHIFVGFQNGVGPQGQASTTGNKDSTVVEFDLGGHAVRHWDVVGKCDGVTADPLNARVIATVNEDAHSSVYVIDPVAGGKAVHFRYSEALPSHGGTDAIEIYHGMILLSASAPGTTGAAAPQARYPAVYRATFNDRTHVATIHALFSDEARATLANTNSATKGKRVRLSLTDPDSNEDVPAYAKRFAGQFMLTSQGDKEQIFAAHAGTRRQSLSVLKLSDSVDDTAWPSASSGAIYTTDNSNNTINKITGPFRRGSVFVADTPCDANGAPATCPGPGFTANYLGELDPNTGVITRVHVHGPAVAPQGMLFVP
jgi:hypothetical protein